MLPSRKCNFFKNLIVDYRLKAHQGINLDVDLKGFGNNPGSGRYKKMKKGIEEGETTDIRES